MFLRRTTFNKSDSVWGDSWLTAGDENMSQLKSLYR